MADQPAFINALHMMGQLKGMALIIIQSRNSQYHGANLSALLVNEFSVATFDFG